MRKYKSLLSKFSGKLIVALLLCVPLSAMANVENPTSKTFKGVEITNAIPGSGSPAAGIPLRAEDDVFVQAPGAAPWNTQSFYSAQNIVQFEIDFANQANKYFHNLNFSATCKVNIKCYNNPSNINLVSQTYSGIDFQINYNSAPGATYKGIATYKFNGFYKVDVEVVSLTTTGLSSPTDYPIFTLTNKLIVNRQFNFVDVTTNPISYKTDGKKLDVSWAPTNYKGAESFDLEWTYVDVSSTDGIIINNTTGNTISATLLEKQFKNNSSRVNLSGSQYQFNLNYNEGFIVFRIRSVQYRNSDGIRLEGNWNYNASPQPGSLYSQFAQGIVKVDWHETDLNWQYNASYAEDGKKKEVISYFDGSLRSRQTVTINNEDNKSVVAEPVYDVMGRSAMSILPAPVNDNVLKYYKSFNLSNRVGAPPVSYIDIKPELPLALLILPLLAQAQV